MGDKLTLRMLSSDEVGKVREQCLRLLSEMGQSIGWMLRVYGELLGQIRRLSD